MVEEQDGYEPRPHEIAGFDPDWKVLRNLYKGTGQKPPIPNLEEEVATAADHDLQ